MTAASDRNDGNPLRRGACPSVATPMQTGDGLLVRLRPVAAALSVGDLLNLAALADRHGNGLVEITARGNIQLRGLTDASVPCLATDLAAASIVPQTGVAIEVPPLSGMDPSEIANAAPLADAVRKALAAASLALAPKLAIVIDGGGALSLADMVADIRLDAVSTPDGVAWRLSTGGTRHTAKAIGLLAEDAAIKGVLATAKALAAIGSAARGRDIDAAALAATLDVPPASAIVPIEPTHPLGAHDINGEIVLGLAPAYGQVKAERLSALATALATLGAFEFRLAPHRTLLVRGLSHETLAAAQAAAARKGFWATQDAPGRAISICAGAAGCASASFDTHAAADAVVAEAAALLDGSVELHISGCPKGCAHPATAAVTLCGTAAGIGLILAGRAADAPSAILPTTDLKPAVQRIGTLLRARRAENETAKSLLDRTTPADLVCAYQGHS